VDRRPGKSFFSLSSSPSLRASISLTHTDTDTGTNAHTNTIIQGLTDEEAETWRQYLQSLYYALGTLVIICYGDVTPVSTGGSLYSLLTIFGGTVLVATLISNITYLLLNIDAADVGSATALLTFIRVLFTLRTHISRRPICNFTLYRLR
jgi:hypothetical protein